MCEYTLGNHPALPRGKGQDDLMGLSQVFIFSFGFGWGGGGWGVGVAYSFWYLILNQRKTLNLNI